VRPTEQTPPLEAFGALLQPGEAQEPILAKPVRSALLEWLTEIWAEPELAAVGLKARRRALFSGPPGVGKTTLAHHLSARLGLPMLAVRPERLIDTWLGSTGRNIGQLFDAASAAGPMLLFFDEFDALAFKRRAANQGAEDERNNYTNTLLQRIEQYGGYVIAATNRAAEIDQAIWRRFDMHIALTMPGVFERQRILGMYLAPIAVPGEVLRPIAEAFDQASPALIRQFCEGVKRQIVLGPKLGWPMIKDAVLDRVINAVAPHPDLPTPPLWSAGSRERKRAFFALPWPLALPSASTDAPREDAA